MTPPSATRRRLAGSPLVRAGGAVVVRLIGPELLAALAAEAAAHHRWAAQARCDVARDDERGAPDRWLEQAPGGPVLRHLLHDPGTAATLADLTGIRWSPLGEQGSYSYYCRPGHHLGLHRDIRRCDLAAITCVAVEGTGTGGDLEVLPAAAGTALAGLRAGPAPTARVLRLRPGDTAVLLGGVVPHRVTPVAGRRARVVAPLCFTALGAPAGRQGAPSTGPHRSARAMCSGSITSVDQVALPSLRMANSRRCPSVRTLTRP